MVKFPRVKGNDPIATKTGTATPAFIRFWDQFCRGLEGLFTAQAATDARQDAADAALAEVIDTIAGILNGTVPFSELNVASTQYRSFLQKTDGSKLVNSTGLDSNVVTTTKVAPFGVANTISAYTAAQVNLAPGATTYATVQSLNITPRGGPIELRGSFYLRALVGGGSFTDTLTIERYANGITTYLPDIVMPSAPLTGADQIVGLQSPSWVDPSPPVGHLTNYALRIKSDASGWTTRYASNRLLTALETRITGV